jgi:hypothetical protein
VTLLSHSTLDGKIKDQLRVLRTGEANQMKQAAECRLEVDVMKVFVGSILFSVLIIHIFFNFVFHYLIFFILFAVLILIIISFCSFISTSSIHQHTTSPPQAMIYHLKRAILTIHHRLQVSQSHRAD